MQVTNTHPSYPPPYPDDSLDLKKYFFMILANWYWFVISVFIALGIAWLQNRYTKPVYRVSASIMIQDENRRGLSGYENLIPGMEIFRNQIKVLNEIEVLKSYSLAYRTLSELDFDVTYVGVGRSGFKETVLYNSCPFIVIPDDSAVNRLGYPVYIDFVSKDEYEVIIDDEYKVRETVRYGEKFTHTAFNFTIVLRNPDSFTPEQGYNRYYFVMNSLNGMANAYRGRIGVETNDQRRGSVLFLSMSGHNASQITAYINKLMDVYITKGLEEKNQVAINTVNFIDLQLEILTDSLQGAEMNLQDFRLANRLINITQEGSMAYTRLEKYSQEKVMLELQKRYYEYLKEYVMDRNSMNEVVAPGTVDIMDPLLSGLITQLNQLLAEKEELMFTVHQGHPRLEIITSKIENARNILLENINELIKNNAIALKDAERQLKFIDQELESLPVTERQFISIQRQYKVNDQIYTYLLQKRAEAAIARASNVSDNKILDLARVDNASLVSPKARMNYMIALMLAVFIPLGLLILIDTLNDKISNRTDVENKTSVPIISTIGHSPGGTDIPVFENPKSAIAESFRGLRTNLQYLLREEGQKVITITSTLTGEGKTFCSVNLAAIFAMAGKKTLLVGLDLRKPKVHKIFNVSNKTGVSTCLIGKNVYEEVVRETRIENLDILPAGPVPPNPAELIESTRMREIMDAARQQYDIIIIDTPPFGMVTDALLAGRFSDVSLFLLRQNYSSKGVLELLEDVARKQELKNIGIVMNDIRHKGYYGYGYRYYNYGYGYRYGYGYYREYGE